MWQSHATSVTVSVYVDLLMSCYIMIASIMSLSWDAFCCVDRLF